MNESHRVQWVKVTLSGERYHVENWCTVCISGYSEKVLYSYIIIQFQMELNGQLFNLIFKIFEYLHRPINHSSLQHCWDHPVHAPWNPSYVTEASLWLPLFSPVKFTNTNPVPRIFCTWSNELGAKYYDCWTSYSAAWAQMVCQCSPFTFSLISRGFKHRFWQRWQENLLRPLSSIHSLGKT